MRRFLKQTIQEGNKEMDVFSVSYMASQIGRTPQTIRKWERVGLIPKASYIDDKGRRFYSEPQIKRIHEIVNVSRAKIVPGKPNHPSLQKRLQGVF